MTITYDAPSVPQLIEMSIEAYRDMFYRNIPTRLWSHAMPPEPRKNLDWTKPIRLIAGKRPLRVVGSYNYRVGNLVYVCAYDNGFGGEDIAYVKRDGNTLSGSAYVENVPAVHVRYVNLHRITESCSFVTEHSTLESAQKSTNGMIARRKITFTEGELDV